MKNNLLAPPNALTKRPPFAYPTTNKTEEKDLIYDLSIIENVFPYHSVRNKSSMIPYPRGPLI